MISEAKTFTHQLSLFLEAIAGVTNCNAYQSIGREAIPIIHHLIHVGYYTELLISPVTSTGLYKECNGEYCGISAAETLPMRRLDSYPTLEKVIREVTNSLTRTESIMKTIIYEELPEKTLYYREGREFEIDELEEYDTRTILQWQSTHMEYHRGQINLIKYIASQGN